MARWHRSSCSRPQVIVSGGLPYCVHCYSLAPDDVSEHPKSLASCAPPPRTSGHLELSRPEPAIYTSTSAQDGSVETSLAIPPGTGAALDITTGKPNSTSPDSPSNGQSPARIRLRPAAWVFRAGASRQYPGVILRSPVVYVGRRSGGCPPSAANLPEGVLGRAPGHQQLRVGVAPSAPDTRSPLRVG